MTGIDNMLGYYLKKSLETELGEKTVSKIIEELHSWYQISLDDAITQFDKIDRILVNIYGNKSAKSLEKRFLKPIIEMSSAKQGEMISITIKSPELIQSIISIIEDVSFRKIFDAISVGNNNDASVENILNIANLDLSEQSSYKKIDILIKTGLIMETGYTMGSRGRRVKTYQKIFDKINIKMNHKLELVLIINDNSVIKKSLILQTICA
ncbi:MAG: hypothetical protein HRO68_07740 [Nitrosopumilus sp.]|nr:hypothetical protein [Nitrosopumilus sp.]